MITQFTLDGLMLEIEWSAAPIIEIEGIWIQQPGPDGKLIDVPVFDILHETYIARISEKLYQELDEQRRVS